MEKGIILGGIFWISGLERGWGQRVGVLKNGEERSKRCIINESTASNMAAGEAQEAGQEGQWEEGNV